MKGRELDAVVEVMKGFPVPWCIAGGWAIDLFLGRVTRPHGDVDLAIFRDDQLAIHGHFTGWEIRKVVRGRFQDWPSEEWLALPVHEIHVQSPNAHSIVVEILLNERKDDEWVFRPNPTVRRPVDQVMQVGWDGLPILSPVVVLLYKSKNPMKQDEHDFEMVRRVIGSGERRWLKDALECVQPGHEWSRRL